MWEYSNHNKTGCVIFRQVREDEELKNVMEETFKTPEIQSRDIGAAQQKVASIFISQSQKVQVCVNHFSEYDSFSRKKESVFYSVHKRSVYEERFFSQ